MGHLKEALARIRADSDGSNTKLGRNFELTIRRALAEHDTPYSNWFERVLTWGEWRDQEIKAGGEDPGKDTGIDLVAELAEGRGLCAIQVKCYNRNKVASSEVNKFLKAADHHRFSERMFISTTGVTPEAYKDLTRWRARVVSRDLINSWVDDWRKVIEKPDSIQFGGERYEVRDDQREAIEAVTKGLFAEQPDGGAGTVVMPCGTGKSVTALWIAERNVTRPSHKQSAQRADVGDRDPRLPDNGQITAGKVLYLVPSLALMSQTMREWAGQRNIDEYEAQFISVCSDIKATKSLKSKRRLDLYDLDMVELPLPPTTDPNKLAEQLVVAPADKLTCVFATYQSLDVVADAQALAGEAGEFDLVICDEAHRTASLGQKGAVEDTNFLLVHDRERIRVKHRLFMTATPRVYTESVKAKATEKDVALYSMDDENLFGKRLYEMSFRKAIDADLLVEFDILVVDADLTGVENIMMKHTPAPGEDTDAQGHSWSIEPSYAAKLLGCWDALSNPHTAGLALNRESQLPAGMLNGNPQTNPPLQRVIGFCNTVARSEAVRDDWELLLSAIRDVHKGDYKKAADERDASGQKGDTLQVDVKHIDGTMSSWSRDLALEELRNEEADVLDKSWARVIMNARCLSEGVDVPSLDAVMFLDPRQSAIDVVQAVGRVMRRHPDDYGKPKSEWRKKKGYIVLPILVEPGENVFSEKTMKSDGWKMVTRVVNALRAHDESLTGTLLSEVIAQDKLPIRFLHPKNPNRSKIRNITQPAEDKPETPTQEQYAMDLLMLADGKLPMRVASKLVKECGEKKFWPSWGKEVKTGVDNLRGLIDEAITEPGEAQTAFAEFKDEIAKSTFVAHTDSELTEMLSHHAATAPLLKALLDDGETFMRANPIGEAIGGLFDTFKSDQRYYANRDGERLRIADQIAQLEKQTDRMCKALAGIDKPEAKMDALKDIYDTFFVEVMPEAVSVNGIAYTDTALVDFILRCADAALKTHLGAEHGLGDPGVDVLDPAAGTGTFINRILTGKNSDGNPFVADEHLDAKYGIGGGVRLHANEIMLLSYYVALLKTEEGYRQRKKGAGHTLLDDTKYRGIALVDTLKSGQVFKAQQREEIQPELDEPNDEHLKENYRRLNEERGRIKAIAGNPPWDTDTKVVDDLAKQAHKRIEERILETYSQRQADIAKRGGAAMGGLDIRFFRWSSDELQAKPDGGVMAFVHKNSLLTGVSLAGMRRVLREEFDFVYAIDTRGNGYKQGEARKAEGDTLFSQTRTGAQITICVRLPDSQRTGKLGEVRLAQCRTHLTRQQKLDWLVEISDIRSDEFKLVPPNEREDWEHQSDGTYDLLLPATKKDESAGIFGVSPSGVTTAWDSWVYAPSITALRVQVERAMAAFNEALNEVAAYTSVSTRGLEGREFTKAVEMVVKEHTRNKDDQGEVITDIKWCDHLKKLVAKFVREHLGSDDPIENWHLTYDENRVRACQYRPFTVRWMYWDERLLSSVPVDLRKMFPMGNGGGSPHTPQLPVSDSDLRDAHNTTTSRPQRMRNGRSLPDSDSLNGSSSQTHQQLQNSVSLPHDYNPTSMPPHQPSAAAVSSPADKESQTEASPATRQEQNRPNMATPLLSYTATGVGTGVTFSVLASRCLPNLSLMGSHPTRVVIR